ncbi:mitochondrial CII assembly factor 4 (SdhAF4) [Andalucia godoyi]|uniref:Succinate dehydrogenase assembly factor 4, mitochondrial n=1 Tax=Andalucia godoyi TaxID=505711 RepID=A0A8K0AH92_ANDGO|nr:mitochondrial CII assembly factor 4 (SdhAF4) [Andalucia godoyi]|eukprot:ANDGO_07843.mRNA.1 mitochondrial CII assembly factor 4 (Sdh8)
MFLFPKQWGVLRLGTLPRRLWVRSVSGCGAGGQDGGSQSPSAAAPVDLAAAFRKVRGFSDADVKRMLMELEQYEDEIAAKEAEEPPARNPANGEWNGPKGPEPTRFSDWERGGRVSDF